MDEYRFGAENVVDRVVRLIPKCEIRICGRRCRHSRHSEQWLGSYYMAIPLLHHAAHCQERRDRLHGAWWLKMGGRLGLELG